MANYYDIPSVVIDELKEYFGGWRGYTLCTDSAELVGNAWQCMMDAYEANVDEDTAAQILNNIGIPNIRAFEAKVEEKYPNHFCLKYKDPVRNPLEWLYEALGAVTMDVMNYIFYGDDIEEDSRIRLIQTQITNEAYDYELEEADIDAIFHRLWFEGIKRNSELVKLLPTRL